MNTKKSIVLTMAIATMFLIATIGSASAADCGAGTAKPVCECGDTVKGDFTFTTDLTCPTTHGLIIGAPNIVIEGYNATDNAYYEIDGVNNGNCADIDNFGYILRTGIYNPGHDNVTINNLTIGRFCEGIRIGGTEENPVEDNTIYNCTVYDNGNNTITWLIPGILQATTNGIRLQPYVIDSTIAECTIYGTMGALQTPPCMSGGKGIFMNTACDNNNITNNTFYGNRGAAILGRAWSTYNHITNNNIYENGEETYLGPTGGIVLRCYKSHYWTIDNNTITDNYGPGVWVGGGWNTIRDNVITGSKNRPSGDLCAGNGISICRCGEGGEGGMNNVIKDNTVCDNEEEDIFVLTPGYNNTGDDNTCDSCANYNDEGETCCTYPCSVQVTFEKELVTGWNLVSLPLTPSDKAVSSVLNSIAGNYDAVVRYDVATHKFMELSADSEMNNGVGYFIHINETGTFTWNYSGTAYDSINVGLSQGLNCIGWTNTSTSLPDALNSIAGNYNYVAMWNTTLQSYEVYEPNAPAPFNDFAEMERGVGYFIAAKGTCMLTYP
jgi:parallel beta-helix repeat protein